MSDQFKALATSILEERSQKFGEDSPKAIGTLLDPVKTKLGEFQTKVDGFQQQHETTAAALGNELKHLDEISRGMTEEGSESPPQRQHRDLGRMADAQREARPQAGAAADVERHAVDVVKAA